MLPFFDMEMVSLPSLAPQSLPVIIHMPLMYTFPELTFSFQSDKLQLLSALNSNRYNTVTDLRRVERVLAYLNDAEVTEPMTRAWRYYVDSHNFLSELRGLSRNYPFSSECLDEAKILVQQDPASIRSWNYCWLILVKIQHELV